MMTLGGRSALFVELSTATVHNATKTVWRVTDTAMAARKHYLLRIRPELYEALEGWAADELRSVNAQIEYLLDDAVARAGRRRRRPR